MFGYHEERPHQSLDNEPLMKPQRRGRPKKHLGPLEEQVVPLSEVCCKERLGGISTTTTGRRASYARAIRIVSFSWPRCAWTG